MLLGSIDVVFFESVEIFIDNLMAFWVSLVH